MRPEHTVGYLLQHVATVLAGQSDQVLQERLGIGMSQYKILMMLQALPSLDQRTVADSLGQTEASISRQIKLLQEKGLLTTHVDPKERRRHIITPTTKGLKITAAARDALEHYQAPQLEGLGDKQQQQLKEMLITVHRTICAPGRPLACDHPFDVADVYNKS